MSEEQQVNGHDQQPQEGVSRETMPPELRIVQRAISAVMRKAENVCESLATLTDQVFIPVLLMVEVRPQQEPGVTHLGQCLVSGPQGIPNDKLVMLLKEVVTNVGMALETPPADAPETEDAPPLGSEEDATQAMRQAMQEPEA